MLLEMMSDFKDECEVDEQVQMLQVQSCWEGRKCTATGIASDLAEPKSQHMSVRCLVACCEELFSDLSGRHANIGGLLDKLVRKYTGATAVEDRLRPCEAVEVKR